MRGNERLARSVASALPTSPHFGRTLGTAGIGANQPLESADRGKNSVPPQTRPISSGTNRNVFGELVMVNVCEQCEKPFETSRSHAVYCSGRCKQAAYRARKKRG